MAKKKRTPVIKPDLTPKPITEFTMGELLREVDRRSLGCYICVVTIHEGNKDGWQFVIKGSDILVGSMDIALARRLQAERDISPDDE